jgi:hypothetical protein
LAKESLTSRWVCFCSAWLNEKIKVIDKTPLRNSNTKSHSSAKHKT